MALHWASWADSGLRYVILPWAWYFCRRIFYTFGFVSLIRKIPTERWGTCLRQLRFMVLINHYLMMIMSRMLNRCFNNSPVWIIVSFINRFPDLSEQPLAQKLTLSEKFYTAIVHALRGLSILLWGSLDRVYSSLCVCQGLCMLTQLRQDRA